MCLAIPAEIVELEGEVALVDLAGNRRRVNVSLLDGADVGDYVLVHAGFAISRLSAEEARETLEAFKALEKAISDTYLGESAEDD